MNPPGGYRRGDVVLLPFPYVNDPKQAKLRPALIIQNDIGNRVSPNVIVLGISSQIPPRAFPTKLMLPLGSGIAAGSGLDRDSVVEADIVVTVSKSIIRTRLGHLGPQAMNAVDSALRVSCGLL